MSVIRQNLISAKKGDITIFTVETTNKIERVEAWCSQDYLKA
jgi:hypothetical protein